MEPKNIISRSLLIIAVVVLLQVIAFGQGAICKNAGLVSAEFSGTKLLVRLSLGVTDKDNLDQADRWRIVKISAGADASPPAVTGVNVTSQFGPGNTGSYFIYLTYSGAFEPKKTYAVAVNNITFDGCSPGKEGFVTFAYNPPSPGTAPAEPSPYDLAKTSDRTKADIYLMGNLEGTKGEKAVKSVDLKVQLPFAVDLIQRGNLLIPYLDMKYSSNKKANTDSLNVGLILRSGANLSKEGFFRSIVWDLDGRIEGNNNLKFINGIVGNRFTFVTKVFDGCGGSCYFYVQPFVGVEVGKNMRTPVVQAKDKSVARPLVGATAFLGFPINKYLLDSINFQSEYTRRWSLTSEVGVDKAGDNYVPVYAGRGPRDYVNSKVDFQFNDYMGFSIAHTYGSLPPNFKLVDNKYTIGLTFRSLVLKRPKP